MELTILAGRMMNHLLEAFPQSASYFVRAQVITSLCEKLINIIDMDVAETCLSVLRRISQQQPTAVLQSGGLAASLAFFDFFSPQMQYNGVTCGE